ncbi:hypothetical protein ALO80_101085 [Pseudomonas caricapapayae]|nr:hypothetical protein ALO80_101085 [Pseudomonas caricapapayae]RMV95162.1 hypothetical protein ALP01_100724 [Pseudomonas caricapapayae]
MASVRTQARCCLLHLVNSARTAAHSPGSEGDDSSLQISIKVMFIYMQITKSDKQKVPAHVPACRVGKTRLNYALTDAE